jgi:hypothetical protein
MSTMKTILLATALVLPACAASAGCGAPVTCLFEMPKELRGQWCSAGGDYYTRGSCEDPLVIGRTSYRNDGGETVCTLNRVSYAGKRRPNDWWYAKLNCEVEEDRRTINASFRIEGNRLHMRVPTED